jgi:hypothetical protein
MATDSSVRGFYLVTDKIKNELLANDNVKTVTFGDITDIDLGKMTMFPLAHVIIENVTNSEKTLQFDFTVLTMEQIDSSKSYDEDPFINNNTIDILNTQLAVSNRMISRLRMGQLHDLGYRLVGDATCEPFFDRFENVLAGWATSFTVEILNDINVC